jgi:DNA primase
MENVVEEIKKRIDIVDFIGSFISLKKTGRNFKALCPFHQEKTPSFIISPERQIWHCFGACGDGGDIIKFLMKWENLTFFEALRELAKKAGVQIKKIDFEDKSWEKKKRFLDMNQLAADFFQFVLLKTDYGKKALNYLYQRKIKTSTIKTFNLGYAPLSWNSLFSFLKRKKYEEEEMLENGLLVRSEKGSFYDRFRGRLIFPIYDSRGNIIAFSGRTLIENDKEAKYINSPETPLYHKRETLFGFHLAKESIKKQNNVYIVEGEFDMITPYQAGFYNFVAIKGSALTKEQLMILKRYTERVTLTLDADVSGLEAIKRGIEEAEKFDFDVNVVVLDFAKDPDEAIKTNLEKFRDLIKRPIGVYDFLIDLTFKKYPEKTAYDKKKISEELIPYLSEIKNNIVQSHYIKKVSSLLEVTEQSVQNLIKRNLLNKKRKQEFIPLKKSDNKQSHMILVERYLLSFIFQNNSPFAISDLIFSIILPEDFSLPSLEKIAKKFLEFKNNNKEFILEKFIDFLPEELRPAFDEIYLFASLDINLENEEIEKIAAEIKKNSLKRQIKKIISLDNQKDEDKERLKSLNKQLAKVEKKLISL